MQLQFWPTRDIADVEKVEVVTTSVKHHFPLIL